MTLVVIILLLWLRRRRLASRGNFARVDLSERPFDHYDYGRKGEVTETIYHVTPYEQEVPVLAPSAVSGVADTARGGSQDVEACVGTGEDAKQEKRRVVSSSGSHVGRSSQLESGGFVGGNRLSRDMVSEGEVDEDMGDTLPPNYLTVMGQSSGKNPSDLTPSVLR